MDAYLAIASRRDERRYRPDPLPDVVVERILDAGRLSGSASNRQPWTFVIPSSPERLERIAETVFEPGNIHGAGLVVAIVVEGKGPVRFDAGRAAQNMLLAAWNARASRRARTASVTPRVSTPLSSSRTTRRLRSCCRSACPRSRATSPHAARRSGAPVRTANPGRARPPTRLSRRRPRGRRSRRSSSATAAHALGAARRDTPTRGGPEAVATEIVQAVRDAASAAGVDPSGLAGVGIGAPGSIDVSTGSVLQVANVEGLDRPYPLAPAVAAALGARDARQRRQRRRGGRAPARRGSRAAIVPRRLLGHRRRRRPRRRRPPRGRGSAGEIGTCARSRRKTVQLRPARLRRGVRRPGPLEERAQGVPKRKTVCSTCSASAGATG